MNFKKWSAPLDLENGMFEIPHVWQVTYMTGKGSENKNMNKFKKAACTNVQVQANSSTDMHVAHDGGVPIITSLSLNFMEVDIITRKDHTKKLEVKVTNVYTKILSRTFLTFSTPLRWTKQGSPNYINIKDYFHLMTVRDDIYREETLYTTYTVQDGERPDQISYKFYGDEQWYWILLQVNEITDYYTQWPLSEQELGEYVNKKYGGTVGSAMRFTTMKLWQLMTQQHLQTSCCQED